MAKQKMLDKVISEHYLSEDVWKKVELSQKEFDQLYKELTGKKAKFVDSFVTTVRFREDDEKKLKEQKLLVLSPTVKDFPHAEDHEVGHIVFHESHPELMKKMLTKGTTLKEYVYEEIFAESWARGGKGQKIPVKFIVDLAVGQVEEGEDPERVLKAIYSAMESLDIKPPSNFNKILKRIKEESK